MTPDLSGVIASAIEAGTLRLRLGPDLVTADRWREMVASDDPLAIEFMATVMETAAAIVSRRPAASADEPVKRSCFNCVHLTHNIVGAHVCALAYESGAQARSYGFIAATGAMSTGFGLTPQHDASTCGGWAPRRNTPL